MIIRKFSKNELAYIIANIYGIENIDISRQIGLDADIDTIKNIANKFSQSASPEIIQELQEYNNSEYFLKNYSGTKDDDAKNKKNPFLDCIHDNQDKFFYGLLGGGKKIELKWRGICKDLLIESIKIFCTPYQKEYYMKVGDNEIQYIGSSYEKYLEKLYSMVGFEYTTLIPFSSFISSIKTLRVYEDLEPNRDYILFNDCLLNINTGEILQKKITTQTVPYAIIEYNYKQENKAIQDYLYSLFKRIDTDNIMKSLLYGMFNKRVLRKTSAIFNIQRSNMGKTLLITPFTELGLFNNVNHEMLKGYDKSELFKQYYTIVFEEIQERVINGSGFNSLIDNTSMAVPRKYKEAITVPKELKPVVYINGESMPNFKGRTAGSFNRFVFIPNYKEPLNELDYHYLNEQASVLGVELLRHLINYMKTVSKEVLIDNIENAKKTEKEIFDLKENKAKIVFEYIEQEPVISRDKAYCITESILIELIKELQSRKIITVDLFNSDTSIRQFIRKTIIESIETNIEPHESRNAKICKAGKWKTAQIKYILQLTEKGKEILTDLGYQISSLEY